jgi:hypothetical protein
MSIWTTIDGRCEIRKDDKVSIREVINSITDESQTIVSTEDMGATYKHTFNANICLDLMEMQEHLKNLPNTLKAKKGTFDVTVTGRILA